MAAPPELSLRRPFSVAGVRGRSTIELLVELRGRATRALAELPEGSTLDVLGPLGRGFSEPVEGQACTLVAGGIGVAGLRMLAERLAARRTPTVVLVGARTREGLLAGLLPSGGEGGRYEIDVATEDGTAGYRGTVTELLEARLGALGEPRVYCCGPPGMIREVARIAERQDLRCEALLEEVMACGVGACRGCVVETHDGYRPVCSDGPVFDVSELVFEEEARA